MWPNGAIENLATVTFNGLWIVSWPDPVTFIPELVLMNYGIIIYVFLLCPDGGTVVSIAPVTFNGQYI